MDLAEAERKRLSSIVDRHFKADDEIAEAWEEYTGDTYEQINLLKRDPKGFKAGYTDDAIRRFSDYSKSLDKLIDEGVIENDITVARGVVNNSKFDPGKLRAGQFFSDPAYTSATTDMKRAVDFSKGDVDVFGGAATPRGGVVPSVGDEGWVFVTDIPKGTHAMIGADFDYELVLPPGTRQRVLKVDRVKRIIYSEVVGA